MKSTDEIFNFFKKDFHTNFLWFESDLYIKYLMNLKNRQLSNKDVLYTNVLLMVAQSNQTNHFFNNFKSYKTFCDELFLKFEDSKGHYFELFKTIFATNIKLKQPSDFILLADRFVEFRKDFNELRLSQILGFQHTLNQYKLEGLLLFLIKDFNPIAVVKIIQSINTYSNENIHYLSIFSNSRLDIKPIGGIYDTIDLIIEETKKAHKIINKIKPLPFLEDFEMVYELQDLADFSRYGLLMSNCLNEGYALFWNKNRFFVIQDEEGVSCLSVEFSEYDARITSHKASLNQRPAKGHLAIAREVIEVLQMKRLLLDLG